MVLLLCVHGLRARVRSTRLMPEALPAVKSVELFRGVDSEATLAVCTALKPCVAEPGDQVLVEDERGAAPQTLR